MTKAQVIRELGPPEVMRWEDWEVPPPGEGEVRMRHTAIGVNFADTYHRGGISHPLKVPSRPSSHPSRHHPPPLTTLLTSQPAQGFREGRGIVAQCPAVGAKELEWREAGVLYRRGSP